MFAIVRCGLLGVGLLLVGCHQQGQLKSTPQVKTEAASQTLAPQTQPSFVMPYPRAAWRLAKPDELSRVVLWSSQILIRHAGVRNEVSFNLAEWFAVPPASTRSREAALGLAQQIAADAARDPKLFPELARRYSEDLPRRDEGGALGGMHASELAQWPQVLDALAALEPGQTSQVVETRYGFHVLQRSLPPPKEVLSGAHIVIGHAQATWLRTQGRGPQPTRSRSEALALAKELHQKARSAPHRFGDLVTEHSEHEDAAVGGDFGSWSSHESDNYGGRLKRLAELSVGAVGAPIETQLGFEIILRTESRPRPQYRARAVVFAFDPGAPADAPLGRANAFGQAQALSQELVAAPERFDQLSHGEEQWEEGRGVPSLTLLLARMDVGHIAPAPIEIHSRYFVVKRVAPEPTPPLSVATELPAPSHPDVEYFIASLPMSEALTFLRAFAAQAEAELKLMPSTAERLRVLHDVEGRLGSDAPPDAPLHVFQTILEGAQRLLGEAQYITYQSVLHRAVAATLLGAPADSLAERGL